MTPTCRPSGRLLLASLALFLAALALPVIDCGCVHGLPGWSLFARCFQDVGDWDRASPLSRLSIALGHLSYWLALMMLALDRTRSVGLPIAFAALGPVVAAGHVSDWAITGRLVRLQPGLALAAWFGAVGFLVVVAGRAAGLASLMPAGTSPATPGKIAGCPPANVPA